MRPRLALFDCDGTLADSQREIVTAMAAAFAGCGLAAPSGEAVRAIIGLSVEQALHRLAPSLAPARRERLAEAYRAHYFAHRTAAGAAPEPLYDGVPAMLDALADAGWTLGVATGKSRRGLDRLLAAHGIADRFATLQTADHHPSKPDPAMARAAMGEVGADPRDTVVIGDTAYDMLMARDAGARALGVAWGYHAAAELARSGAVEVAAAPADIPHILERLTETAR